MYRTGDLGRWLADGTIEYLGRNDFQVKLRGFRIELGEIETQLRALPGVGEAAVLARTDQGEQRLVAYVVPAPGHAVDTTADTAALRAGLAAALPNYMVPSAFVCLDTLPLTPNGKLDRRALPAPDFAAAVTRYRQPRTQAELRLCMIWEDLLGVSPVSIDADFFDLGGHSLLAVRMVRRIQSELDVNVNISTLFAHPTIEGLAASLEQGGQQEGLAGCVVPIQPKGSRRPLFAVHAAGGTVMTYSAVARVLGPDQPVYGLQSIGLSGEAAPLHTMEAMAAHYIDALRRVQPEGPYRLLGYSSGAHVATEIARRLLALGEPVEYLGLIDVSVRKDVLPFDAAQTCRELAAHHEVQLPDAASLLPADELLALVIDQCERQAIPLPGRAQDVFAVWVANAQAFASHVTTPLNLPMHLYFAGDHHTSAEARLSAWQAIMPGQLYAGTIEGADHQSIITGDHAGILGRMIAGHLTATPVRLAAVASTTRAATSQLVTIQNGLDSMPPVFCLPGAGANIACFTQLAHALGTETPVHGMQHRGLDGAAPPFASVAEAARSHIAELLPLAGDERIRLVGHSFGAWVAFQMALELQAAGRPLDKLVLLDARGPAELDDVLGYHDESRALILLMRLLSLTSRTEPEDLGFVSALPRHGKIVLLKERMVERALIPARLPHEVIDHMFAVFSANVNSAWVPSQAFHGEVVLLQASEQFSWARGRHLTADEVRAANARELAKWRKVAPKIVACQCEGDHMGMVARHAPGLAGMIQTAWFGAALSPGVPASDLDTEGSER
jgi:thioesterase domain-containing protein/acyl carrier protein